MNESENFLASSPHERRLPISASSSSMLGLQISDIIKHGLVPQKAIYPAHQFATPISLSERIFHALSEAKILTSRVAMRLDLASRDRIFHQLDLLHDCDEWFGEDQPLLLASYKSFVRFMISEGSQSKPSLALNPDGHLLAVWENSGNRLTIEFQENDKLQWVISCADGDRTAGITRLDLIMSRLAPYNPEALFCLG
jgi:hypothetical protein